ncbi:hypothetical protein A6A25_29205 [Saccharothrix sp. CB00851]|nr:hypothetical protein A6A25_29205 [Saccharothrix sp. CB00851]
MIHPPAGPPPSPHVWISEPGARHVHAACGSTGRLFAVLSLVLGTAVVLLGLRLPIAYHFFGKVVWINGGTSVLAAFFSALSLVGARPYLRGGYLHVDGARRTRRALAAMWVTSIVFSSFSCLLLLVTVAAESDDPYHPEVRFTIGVVAYLFLLASPAVLGGVLFFVGRRLLTPVPPLAHLGVTAAPTAPHPPPQRHVWISAARVREVRVACGRLGAALLTAGALLPTIAVVTGYQLPPLYPALSVQSWAFAVIGLVQVFVAATVVRGGRRCVTGEHLDLDGALTTRKSLGVIWGFGLFCTVFSGVGLVLGLATATGEAVRYSPAVWAVLSLMVMPGVLTDVAYFTGRRLFTPPIPAR